MIGDILQPTHLLFVLVVALLVLGPKRLPEVGKALGRGLRDFRQAVSGDEIRDALTGTPETPHDAPEPVSDATPAPPATGAPDANHASEATQPLEALGGTPNEAAAPQPPPADAEPAPAGEQPETVKQNAA